MTVIFLGDQVVDLGAQRQRYFEFWGDYSIYARQKEGGAKLRRLDTKRRCASAIARAQLKNQRRRHGGSAAEAGLRKKQRVCRSIGA